jgi:peptidoglycan LD-endopeptidase CwlK
MAARLFENDIVFLQRFLKSAGFYSGKIDGIWGPKTDAAVNELDSISKEISLEFGTFDTRTERNLVTLHPEAQRAARVFMRRVVNAGFNLRILSGTRSYAEQDAFVRTGPFQTRPSCLARPWGREQSQFRARLGHWTLCNRWQLSRRIGAL